MSALGVFAFVFLGFSSTAVAQAVASDQALQQQISEVLRELVAGHYAYAAALLLVLSVALVRRYATDRVAWLRTDQGGAALVLLGAFGGAIVAAASGTRDVTWALAQDAAIVAFAASGGYSLIKRLVITPYVAPLAQRPDAWGAVAKLIVWIFDTKGSKQ